VGQRLIIGDLAVEIFLQELQYLIHEGLIDLRIGIVRRLRRGFRVRVFFIVRRGGWLFRQHRPLLGDQPRGRASHHQSSSKGPGDQADNRHRAQDPQ
jgi:hypothetical protein